MTAPSRPRRRQSSDGPRALTRVMMEWLLTAVVTGLLVTWLALSSVTERADNLLYDSFSRLDAPAPSDDIVVIGIDDRSLAALGPWPWPRDTHARLLDKLAQAESGPIAYDVLFLEPTNQDQALADAIAKAGNVWLATLITNDGLNGAAYGVDTPVPPLAAAATGLGHVVLTPDRDGTVRHLPLWVQAGDRTYPDLVAPLRVPKLATPAALAWTTAPVVSGETLIRYPASGYRVLSFVDVLNGEIQADYLKGRRVLVGATAYGMGDRYATTTTRDDELTPGVEIQAALLQTLMSGTGPVAMPPVWRALISIIPLAIMLAGFLWLRPVANMALGMGLLAACVGASAVGLYSGWWWPPMSAIAGVIIAWPLWSWRRLAATYRYMQTELETLQTHQDQNQIAALSPAPAWQSGDQISRQVRALSTALKQVRDFNQFISQSVRSLPDAAVIADADGKVLVANARARKLFDAATLANAHVHDLYTALGYPDWAPVPDAEGLHDDLVTASGRALQIATAPLIDTDGQPAGCIVRFADVTQLRASERQRELTLQLLGHDMRAPQVSILTMLDNPSRPDDFDKRIRANAKQTLSLAEGYVQLSRAESQLLRYEPVDLGELLIEAADMMWPQAAAKGVHLISPDAPDADCLIDADASLLRRVVINLLDNAVRHTPTGARVMCDVLRRDDHVILTIADDGPGFDPDLKKRMFQPFQGGSKSPGAGLGLAFVNTVITRHGGTISLDPIAGVPMRTNGTCFYITLPMAAAEGHA